MFIATAARRSLARAGLPEIPASIHISKRNGPKSEKKKGEHIGSPLQKDIAPSLMIQCNTSQTDAHGVGADLRVCPIDVFCELLKMRLGRAEI